jgi:hypothetical protein
MCIRADLPATGPFLYTRQNAVIAPKHADATSTETGLSYSVRIEVTFGSHFQRSVAIQNLNAAHATWKALVEAKDKQNAVTVVRSKD